jgi:hypothetical protein
MKNTSACGITIISVHQTARETVSRLNQSWGFVSPVMEPCPSEVAKLATISQYYFKKQLPCFKNTHTYTRSSHHRQTRNNTQVQTIMQTYTHNVCMCVCFCTHTHTHTRTHASTRIEIPPHELPADKSSTFLKYRNI